MGEAKPLTEKQRYLQYLIPRLNDAQIDGMVSLIESENNKASSKSESASYANLMKVIGCEEAKKKLTAMIADHRMRKIAAARGKGQTQAYYHAVFTGNPGCNKTSVARMYAKALADEGITRNSSFVELSRSGIVGQYVGATAAKVHGIWEKNAGGVIFIDEAYSLNDGRDQSNNNYGEEAINEIIVCMENHPETVVIFAGYPGKMDEFLRANPGLRSRVPYHVTFSDYTTEELLAISDVIAEEKGFRIVPSAEEKLRRIFETAKAEPDFGNGRYVRNVIERAVRTKGIQLGVMDAANLDSYINGTTYSDDLLFSLDEACFNIEPKEEPTVKRTIGFC